MNHELRLADLLLRWEVLWKQGHDVPLAEFCRDCPELAQEFGVRLASRKRLANPDRLADLLLRWEDQYEQGRDSSAEELCPDCPELIPLLAKRIAALKRIEWLQNESARKAAAPSVRNSVPVASQAGVVIEARYRLVRAIAEGGFGQVWQGFDLKLQRPIALKMPKPGRSPSSARIEEFLVEARKVARLKHPGIVPVHDVVRHNGMYVIVSDLIDGIDLGQRLRSDPPSVREAVRIVAEVANHLHYAHEQGVIHRDIKPSNILVDGNGRVFITDFGIAVTEQELRERGADPAGTWGYMSPEQQAGDSRRIDCRSDIYSLGVMLHELMTGVRPSLTTTVKVRGQNRTQAVGSEVPSERTIPLHLEAICRKSLAIHPADRYATATEFGADLRAALARLLVKDNWFSCTDPLEMFGQLHPCASLRKMRLFVCACIRHTYRVLDDERSRTALEVSERFADGGATLPDLRLGRVRAVRVCAESPSPQAHVTASSVNPDIWPAVFNTSLHTDRALQCHLLRELFGPLLFRSLTIQPASLSWNNGMIPKLARAIYEERAFDRIGELADALAESGCGNEEIIAHCRSNGPHVKGCWALDLLLGKS